MGEENRAKTIPIMEVFRSTATIAYQKHSRVGGRPVREKVGGRDRQIEIEIGAEAGVEMNHENR